MTDRLQYAQGYAQGIRDRFNGEARSTLWVTNPSFDSGYQAGWDNRLDDEAEAEVLMSCRICTLGPSDHGELDPVKDHEWSDPTEA